MKLPFSHILAQSTDFYVVHQIMHSDIVLNALSENSVLFLDDCLYSQYVFLLQNINQLKQKNINCVISFSTSIYRHTGSPIEYAECALCHKRFHDGDMSVLQCYMSLDEIKTLLTYDNVYLACHGSKHLQLQNIDNKFTQSRMFLTDVNEAIIALQQNNLNTNIFVFPYAYSDFPFAYSTLRKNKFFHVFAGKNSTRKIISG